MKRDCRGAAGASRLQGRWTWSGHGPSSPSYNMCDCCQPGLQKRSRFKLSNLGEDVVFIFWYLMY
jgi:hypothetical protein